MSQTAPQQQKEQQINIEQLIRLAMFIEGTKNANGANLELINALLNNLYISIQFLTEQQKQQASKETAKK